MTKSLTKATGRKFRVSDYAAFVNEIKSRIVAARIQATRFVSKEIIDLYWDIGKRIIERQKRYHWGDAIVERLSLDLVEEFEGAEGFSVQNLWRMRLLYLEYKDHPKLAQAVREIPWGQNIVILQKVKGLDERAYYLRATAEMGWSRDVLLNQIKADAYSLSLKEKQHNFKLALPVHLSEQADESVKSVYNLEFLGVKKPVLERELEKRLVEKLKRFMLELGKGFTFVGNQYRLTLGDISFMG